MYSPALELIVLCEVFVAVSVASTVAPGTTAPDGSVTVPLMPPRNVWPWIAAGSAISTASASNQAVNTLRVIRFFMRLSSR